jgi:hypothetical protein
VYNESAKHRVALEKPESYRPCFALYLIKSDTKEVVMDIQKTCKKHGVLDVKDIRVDKASRNSSGISLRCIKCHKERSWRTEIVCKKHGKLSGESLTTQARCRLCHRETASKKRNLNRAWYNEKIAQDKINNPEKWSIRRKREYQQSLKNVGRSERVLKEILRMKKISHDDYDRMVESQKGLCKICGCEETRAGRTPGTITRLCLDHCHKTGKVRGLLCHRCNIIIGKAADSIEILDLAIIYLQEQGDVPE